jgi:hypothetical protein
MVGSHPTIKDKNLAYRKTMSASIDSNGSFFWFRKTGGSGVDASADAR